MSKITVDAVTAAYIQTRDDIAELNKQIDKLKELQGKREGWLYTTLVSQDMKSVRTDNGTVFQVVKESVTCADWDKVLEWVKKEEKWEFVNKAVNKNAVLEMMGENRENPAPPGVNFVAIRTVQVRKS